MRGGDIMAGTKQPIELVIANGKKHLTKDEIKRRRETEVQAPSDNVEAPSYLTKRQKEIFYNYAKQLIDLKIMSNLDSEALGRYITSNDMYEKLTKKLRQKDVIDNIALFEDYSKAQERYFKLARASANDLGLTISSRCKLTVPQAPKASNPTAPKSKFEKFRGGA